MTEDEKPSLEVRVQALESEIDALRLDLADRDQWIRRIEERLQRLAERAGPAIRKATVYK